MAYNDALLFDLMIMRLPRFIQTLFGKQHSESRSVNVSGNQYGIHQEGDPLLLEMLRTALTAKGESATVENGFLRASNQVSVSMLAMESVALGADRHRTAIRVSVSHPVWFPEGFTEYQHALGKTETDAFAACIQQWLAQDWIVIADAVRETPKDCAVIELPVAGAENQVSGYRQILLGPVAHLVQTPSGKKEEHPFCPCCFVTEVMDHLHKELQSQAFLGIRFFVSRDQQGKLAVDCRCNGENLEALVPVLTKYAERWPQQGLEFRKQFVVVRTSAVSSKSPQTGAANA